MRRNPQRLCAESITEGVYEGIPKRIAGGFSGVISENKIAMTFEITTELLMQFQKK